MMKKMIYLLPIFTLLVLSSCTIHTESHSNGYTKEDLRVARCGMGIGTNDKPAIQNQINTNSKIKEQYETCLRELSH